MNVFVSHSVKTTALAERLADALRAQGFRTWLDSQNLAAGQQWQMAVEMALDDTGAAVFLIEPEASASPQQSWEWSTALEVSWDRPGYLMIPILIDNARPPTFLRDRLALRLRRVSGGLNKLIPQLVSVLKGSNGKVEKTTEKDRERWLRRLAEIKRGVKALD